jgi:hypothetical protein
MEHGDVGRVFCAEEMHLTATLTGHKHAEGVVRLTAI